MTLKTIEELHKLTMALPVRPNQLRFANAYTDQALMNFDYEQMPKTKQAIALRLIAEMIEKFNQIRGR